jgi:hypothetical protein
MERERAPAFGVALKMINTSEGLSPPKSGSGEVPCVKNKAFDQLISE